MAKKVNPKFVLGSPLDDQLDGTAANEILRGFDGNDILNGFGGKDHLFGGAGDDVLRGGTGDDHLLGGLGNDALVGGDGNDKLQGDAGNDLLIGSAGNDVLSGGAGINTFLLRPGFGKDLVTDFTGQDLLDLNGLGFANAAAAKAAMVQAGADVTLQIGTNQLVLQNVLLADIQLAQIIASDQTTGPSTTQSPYLLSTQPGKVEITSILTAGDSVGGYKMAGIPDGLGAFDNGDGTFTVLMNHEIGTTTVGGVTVPLGVVRDHGAAGAFVSEWVIDKTTLEVKSGHDLIQNVFTYDPVAHGYVEHNAALGNGIAFNRFCSADLADASAFYNPLTGLGFDGGRLFLDGEESGVEGRPMAHIASGAEVGNSYELAWLGNMSYENLVANAHTGDKTVVGMMDDGQNNQVYFYYGDKQATGNAIEKAGLTGGHLFGIHVDDLASNSNNTFDNFSPLGADNQSHFSLIDLGDVSAKTGAQIDADSETAGVTSFLRPEDGAWDTLNSNRFYFVTTNAFDTPAVRHPSQLWAVDFIDAANPNAGGTIKLLLDGSEGQNMFDNIAVDTHGKVTLLEDVGNQAHLGKVWQYDPTTDVLSQIAVHDSSRFLAGGANFLTQDEEASGVIDITGILGNAGENVFLVDTQAHFTAGVPAAQVEGGQLQLIHQYLV